MALELDLPITPSYHFRKSDSSSAEEDVTSRSSVALCHVTRALFPRQRSSIFPLSILGRSRIGEMAGTTLDTLGSAVGDSDGNGDGGNKNFSLLCRPKFRHHRQSSPWNRGRS